MASRFLTAEWRDLAMFNFRVAPETLAPFVPPGTEIDFFDGHTFVSVVAFRFADTRILGLPIPFHRAFDEVNLRFYVRRRTAEGWRRGVVFLKEVVARWAVAWVARTVYRENYVCWPMASTTTPENVEYAWRSPAGWNRVRAEVAGDAAAAPTAGSEAEFIVEHYWGYGRAADGAALEYEVRHPPWRLRPALRWSFTVDAVDCYGPAFGAALAQTPTSVFVADGSPVTVHRATKLPRG